MQTDLVFDLKILHNDSNLLGDDWVITNVQLLLHNSIQNHSLRFSVDPIILP